MARPHSKLAQRLVGRVRGKRPPETIATNAEESLSIAPLLDAFAEPLLLLRHSTIARANQAARGLLGAYVEGEDVRLVIRHPDLLEYDDVPSISDLRLFSSGGGNELVEWDMNRGCIRVRSLYFFPPSPCS